MYIFEAYIKLKKGVKINAKCIGSIKEKVDKEIITIKVSFFKKNGW